MKPGTDRLAWFAASAAAVVGTALVARVCPAPCASCGTCPVTAIPLGGALAVIGVASGTGTMRSRISKDANSHD